MREWDLHSYDPAQQFSVRSVTLQAMVELDTDMDQESAKDMSS